MGSIYKCENIYWIQYYRNGKPYRESTKSKKEADAKRLLKKREGEISDGKLPGIYFVRVKFGELAERFLKEPIKLNVLTNHGKQSAKMPKSARNYSMISGVRLLGIWLGLEYPNLW